LLDDGVQQFLDSLGDGRRNRHRIAAAGLVERFLDLRQLLAVDQVGATLALPLLSACASGGGMRPRYDPEEGESNVEQLILQTPQGMRMTARYSWEGRGAPAPAQSALLSFDAPRGGTDNRVAIWSDRYRHQPLVIQGPGAGAEVTAAALLDDVLHLRELAIGRPRAA
jgi:hypothetical protein